MAKKVDPNEAKKKEVIVDGTKLAGLKDEELLDFQKAYHDKFEAIQRENALHEVELNMLRNAWKFAEDKASELELENVMIRRELDLARQDLNIENRKKKHSGFDRKVMYEKIKNNLQKLDEGIENVIHLGSEESSVEENAESMYESKPAFSEARFEADEKALVKDRRLKSKKAKFVEKVNDLKKIQESLERELMEEKEMSSQATETLPSSVEPLSDVALENLALEEGTISSGSVSEKSDHSVINLPNVVENVLTGTPLSKRKTLDLEQREIKNQVLLQERIWKRTDPRYDDNNECDSNVRADSDCDHIFDDFNPMLDEDVDDAVHYHQMRKWLEYDYDILVDEMKLDMERRIKSLNLIWTKDVKNALKSQVEAAEHYDQSLRDTIIENIGKEVKRTERNEEHLNLLIEGLENVRIKMIKERYGTNMCIAKQQTEELNYLIQESYDKTINDLKGSTKFNFYLTQMFFMRSTQNDITLVHELHAEQKRVECNVKRLKAEVESTKKELIKLRGPLEEEEKMSKWMETTIAALQKDMKSKKEQERTNAQYITTIEKLENDSNELIVSNLMLNQKLANLDQSFNEITQFHEKYKRDNALNRKMKRMTYINEKRIITLRKRLKSEFGINPSHIRLIHQKVKKDVGRCEKKLWHNLYETKAFNELVTQFDLRARNNNITTYVGIDKLAIPYRKTSADIITTFDEKKKIIFPFKSASRSPRKMRLGFNK